MHPVLVLLAFGLASLVTYVLVLGLLTALSVSSHEGEPEAEPGTAPGGERATR